MSQPDPPIPTSIDQSRQRGGVSLGAFNRIEQVSIGDVVDVNTYGSTYPYSCAPADRSSTIGMGRSSRRSPVPCARRCGARNNHPDNDNHDNNRGLRVCAAHRLPDERVFPRPCRGIRQRHGPVGGSPASERDQVQAR